MTPANDNQPPPVAPQYPRRLNVLRCVGWCQSIVTRARLSPV